MRERKNKAQFKTKWRSLISIQLQRNLAKVIADKLYRPSAVGGNLLTCARAGGHSGHYYRNENFCAVVGCGNRANHDRDIRFVCSPAIVMVKGENFQKLTEWRRGAWITASNRKDLKQISLKYTCICFDHFVSVKSSATENQTNSDWVPSQKLRYSSRHSLTTER